MGKRNKIKKTALANSPFYIKQEKERKARTNNNTQTLETEVEKIIREQAKRFNMKIE